MENEVLILKQFADNIDWIYLIQINILAYIVIKAIDDVNPDKSIPSWIKTIITFICAIVLNIVEPADTDKLYSTAILSLISWDYGFKYIVKKLKIGYKQSNSDSYEETKRTN